MTTTNAFSLRVGNGVENAFAFSPNVVTLSLHLKESGFYPGTGATADVGFGKGRFHSVNVPFREGVKDEQYKSVFER